MAVSRNIIVAGAGIGGLSAALMLARSGFRVTLIEQAARLEEAGAGVQLSPNATRILIALGFRDRLMSDVVAPQTFAIRTAGGSNLASVPFGEAAERRYGAPFWCVHRGDLQAALLEAVHASPDIVLHLNRRVEDFVAHAHGVSVACRQGSEAADENGIALVGADGLWSELRRLLGHRAQPQFQNRTAWRALVPAGRISRELRSPELQLWLGRNAHVVHYPVKGGKLINVVAIVTDRWSERGWSAEGDRDELLSRFSAWSWAEPVRDLLGLGERWQKWALYDLPPIRHWGTGPVTLLGDAAHPMLPFLAQGAAMAIEDAAVLADKLALEPDDAATAMRRYELDRRKRTARVQRAARSNGRTYHLSAAEALLRNMALRIGGGGLVLGRYNWLYDWRFTPQGHTAELDELPEAQPGEE